VKTENPNREPTTENLESKYRTVLFDIDGTLVDSNEAHAQAWVNAFEEAGLTIDLEKIRRAIGMGGDKLMPIVSRIEENSPLGQSIARRRREIFVNDLLPRVQPFPDAARLVTALKERGYTMVAASSAKKNELSRLLKIAGADGQLDAATSSDDAENSKPDPDIIQVALERARTSPAEAVMIGDTPYDIAAAARAGVQTIAFRCGGWRDENLKGAIAIYDGPWDLCEHLDSSPLSTC